MKLKLGTEEAYAEMLKINSDGYAKGIIDFTKRWAELMEKHLEETKEIDKPTTEKLSVTADTEGITGFMYDCAKSILYKYWEYGEDLKELLGTKSCCIFTIEIEEKEEI